MRILAFVSLMMVILSLAGCGEMSTPDRVEWWLGAPLPADASNVTFREDSGGAYATYLYLQFSASPESVTQFVDNGRIDHICVRYEGLFPGYDPFNSIDTDAPTPDSVLIKGFFHAHYSHSPNTPNTIYGTRRQLNGIGALQIVVNRTDPNLHTVTVEISPNWSFDNWPYSYPFARYITPLEDTEFPLMVIGMDTIDGEYVVTYREICMNTRESYADAGLYCAVGLGGPWTPFLGARVDLFIDNNPLPSAHIPEECGGLIPLSEDGAPIDSFGVWDYCFSPDLTSGRHTMTLQVTTLDGVMHEFAWDFRVE